jgi:hypothetical protein
MRVAHAGRQFCEKYNPLFMARPEWMRLATCVSAYCYAPFYLLIAAVAATGAWARFKTPLLLFLGAKLNAILLYHLSEFTSSMPPPSPLVYFAIEGPYLVSIGLIVAKLTAGGAAEGRPKRA